ncbi:MAG TPA: hypothetical protein VL096_00310, partial [Pirellulaceae bacterium]|nr:hypothetical protein [Pirellulaceae bacterium]
MTGTHRAVNQARPSWKATADKTSAGSIWVQRIGMTLLGLALLAEFVALLYYLFLNRMSEVHFVSLRISDYGQLHAPPIAFAAEDHQALEEAAPQPHDVFFHAIDDTESENSLARLQETCGTVSAGSVLVVYLTAHGISDDNQPWLLASNYAPTVGRAPPGRIALKDVLATLLKAPARQKLLVLDTGRLEQDAAQGMLVNEFPLLVEQEVKALQPGKQSLYVMLPAQFLETSQVSPREQ